MNVIRKTPKDRCDYIMKITNHYLKESDEEQVKEYAQKGLELAIQYNLPEYQKKFQDIMDSVQKVKK